MGRRPGEPQRWKFLLQYAWRLDRLGYTQKQIQGWLRLIVKAGRIVPGPDGKPRSVLAEDHAYKAAIKALNRGELGDVGDKTHPYYRQGARYVEAGKKYVATLPEAFRRLLEQDLIEERRRWLRLQKSVVNSVVESAANAGESGDTPGKVRRSRKR